MNPPTTDALAAEIRRQGARIAKLEDAIGVYGPPPKTKRFPIPEITAGQREFLVWVAVFSIISIVTAARRNHAAS